jgi:hypothetical protein
MKSDISNVDKQQIQKYLTSRGAQNSILLKWIDPKIQAATAAYEEYEKQLVNAKKELDDLILMKRQMAMTILQRSDLKWHAIDYVMDPKRESLRKRAYEELLEDVRRISQRPKLEGGRKKKRISNKRRSKSKRKIRNRRYRFSCCV